MKFVFSVVVGVLCALLIHLFLYTIGASTVPALASFGIGIGCGVTSAAIAEALFDD